jgi:hypothetical protein
VKANLTNIVTLQFFQVSPRRVHYFDDVELVALDAASFEELAAIDKDVLTNR